MPEKELLRYAVKGMEQNKTENVFLFFIDFNFLFIWTEYREKMCLGIEDPMFQWK